MGRVDGKVGIITGGTGGIGGATARLMIEEGATIIVADVAGDGPEIAAEMGAEFVHLDVTNEAEWEQVVHDVDAKHGRIDVLVNAAGIEGDQQHNTIASTSLAEWRRVHAINLDGTFLGCQKVLPVMERQHTGSIVNISSMVTFLAGPVNIAYGSSKAGVQHLSKSVASWGVRDGNQIRCNSVHPGLIRTRMLLTIAGQGSPSELSTSALDERAKSIAPLGGLGDPKDVAYQVLYLASDEARYVTGSEFRVDGGWGLSR